MKPGPKAVWDNRWERVHGLTKHSTVIVSADPIEKVWPEFVLFVQSNVRSNEKCVLVAWSGQTCDLAWLYRLTKTKEYNLDMPEQIQFFMDPMLVIKGHKRCQLNPLCTKEENIKLGTVYEYLFKKPIENAHNSLADAKAQTKIMLHEYFLPFIDRTKSIKHIDDIWGQKIKRAAKTASEPTRPVPVPWKADDDMETWEPPSLFDFKGKKSAGASAEAKAVCAGKDSQDALIELWFTIFTIDLCNEIVHETNRYAFDDWVLPMDRIDRDGKQTKRKYWKHVSDYVDGARHRVLKEPLIRKGKLFQATVGFLIAWHGLLIYYAAKRKRNVTMMWAKPPNGDQDPIAINTMPRDAFLFLCRMLHFCNNSEISVQTDGHFTPMCKVGNVSRVLMDGLRTCWDASDQLTVDESMIKYKGKAIRFVTYLPLKPIKHGIKVYAIVCAYSGVLLGELVAHGRSLTKEKGVKVRIVSDLIQQTGHQKYVGVTVYGDNWYTSGDLQHHLWEKYRWYYVGTQNLTEKYDRKEDDFPFAKMSNTTIQNLGWGWQHNATRFIEASNGDRCCILANTWIDKKQLGFRLSGRIVDQKGNTTKRHVRGQRLQKDISCPQVQQDYAKYFNGVDCNDRDSADYTTSLKTNRWYMRYYFYLLDRVIHAMYSIVMDIATIEQREEWQKYKGLNGRYAFQIDLAMALIDWGIKKDWPHPFDDSAKPTWGRKQKPVPCSCTKCFHCSTGKTT
jgi:hypothetical protein